MVVSLIFMVRHFSWKQKQVKAVGVVCINLAPNMKTNITINNDNYDFFLNNDFIDFQFQVHNFHSSV